MVVRDAPRERSLAPQVKLPGFHVARFSAAKNDDWKVIVRFVEMAIILFIGCALVVGGIITIHRGISVPVRSLLLDWEQSARNKTLHRFHPEMSQFASDEAYLYQPPAHALFYSDYRLTTQQSVTLWDMMIVFGSPSQVDCLETREIPGKLMNWLCVRFRSGRIEGCAFFPEGVSRLTPEAPIHSIYYYAVDSVYSLDPGLPWRGFRYFSAYSCPNRAHPNNSDIVGE